MFNSFEDFVGNPVIKKAIWNPTPLLYYYIFIIISYCFIFKIKSHILEKIL